ncbi:MAG: hypothetical protein AB1599_08795 [Planctomycetota bacterium]
MNKLNQNQVTFSLFILVSIAISLWIFASDEGTKPFKEMSTEEQIEFLDAQVNKYKTNVTELIRYFEQDWKWEQILDKEEIQVKFCNLIKVYKAKEAVPLLVRHFDIVAYYGKESPTTISNRFVLATLAQIGMPALDPTADKICSELGGLTYSEDTRHRIVFLREALKYLTLEILGRKLAIAYLEDKINDKETSQKLKEILTSVLDDIKKK